MKRKAVEQMSNLRITIPPGILFDAIECQQVKELRRDPGLHKEPREVP
jgi:hypothetical protein